MFNWFKKKEKKHSVLDLISMIAAGPDYQEIDEYKHVSIATVGSEGYGYDTSISLDEGENIHILCRSYTLEQAKENHVTVIEHMKENPETIVVQSNEGRKEIEMKFEKSKVISIGDRNVKNI